MKYTVRFKIKIVIKISESKNKISECLKLFAYYLFKKYKEIWRYES